MRTIAIIPARYASTRYPGKPLVEIAGKTMIQRVYEQACKAFPYVCVATDDARIYDNVQSFSGNVIMTSPDHRSGTDRCNEAYYKYLETSHESPFDVIINIQGDEPLIDPQQLLEFERLFEDENVPIGTMAKKIDNYSDLFNPNITKVIQDKNGYAIYFSRTPIPFIRDVKESEWLPNYLFLRHIGLYGFRPRILSRICGMETSSLESVEKLEQLRWIENGLKIKIGITNHETIAVDTPADIQKVLFKMSKSVSL